MNRGDRWKIFLLRRADILAQVVLQRKIKKGDL
jgi:hypothetical protein